MPKNAQNTTVCSTAYFPKCLCIHVITVVYRIFFCLLQPSLQRHRMLSPAWMKPQWCSSGRLLGIRGAARMSSSTSSARAVAEVGEAAPAVGTMFSFCPVSWAWQSPESTLVTCWPTHSTRLRCRLSTGCQIRAPTPPSTPQSTLPLTRLVSGPICLFLHFIFPMWFPLLFSSLLFSSLHPIHVQLLCRLFSVQSLFITLVPLQAHNAQCVDLH